jgi:DHA1 family multidrug resistance protein-like MFS transporter
VEANIKKVVEAPSSHCSAPIYILTLAAFVLLQIPTALATNYGMLMAFFLTGVFGSPILMMGGATIADLYALKKRAYRLTLWGVFITCAPSLGLLLRSFSARFEGWRWMIWVPMWLSSVTFVLLFFPETSTSNILTAERTVSAQAYRKPLNHVRSRDRRSSYVMP